MFTDPFPREAGRISTELTETGYCVVRGAAPAAAIAAIDKDLAPHFAAAQFESLDPGTSRTQRIGRLLLRAPATEQLVRHVTILKAVEDILVHGSHTMQLNLIEGVARHPCERASVPLRDQLSWRGSDNTFEYLVNVVWPLTPCREDNGAVRIWPGSHGSDDLEPAIRSRGVAIEMEPGDALLFLGSTFHNAGANLSGEVTRSMTIGYCLGWLKPTENPWLAYPPEVAREFSPELAALVGYSRSFAGLGNFEGMCPSVLLDPCRAADFDIEDIPCFESTATPASRRLLS